MSNSIFIQPLALITPLGVNLAEHGAAFSQGQSGIQLFPSAGFQGGTLPLGKIPSLGANRYDDLLTQALDSMVLPFNSLSEKLAVIVSSTKGNMNLMPHDTFSSTRELMTKYCPQADLYILSNACISGVMAINTAADFIMAGSYDQVVVIGIDAVSDFVTYGFQSLFALSEEPCKPFDSERNGTTLGEGCGIVVLSKMQLTEEAVCYKGGASSNDANHISGPSRTGEGLVRSIEKTLLRSGVKVEEIDFLSAHGTATVYNDEMESIAFGRTGLDKTPVNSMKGYFGHTLGAAGVLETIMSIYSMNQQVLFPTLNFQQSGTSIALNLIQEVQKQTVHTVLKTASGFGGGNASLILQRIG